ncbi:MULTISPECIES: NAD(P)/FAD-dependent oxidoreductase [Rhodococcus]|uniref:NAD(P)/FAD-dependent oxidoreductase n=1 Tax=Rhodococcus oxybenzonivorans TaxID=1990687 RepID=A0AAE4UZD0_9NOCA|nr:MULTISPECIES: NAD(P)/FAD-dependent oxidoreductase [Rhodococcus]MDV7242813.1 NAD(P)/FAD-dependent oxidoreductase [Rhodococcus oxybenzonivorans]MDV7265600.1 NAD(P)/FAD-dependent oxidoreductase [Rhodococcus oxybenzonivorans]MDV7275217.1 NAD(P)/FAD-dependent oxidoreductase [Rhodococcus oxybenzonivorans]MDV7334928.1 NAD(P)/FAD-dependent oxidoreductase [Rhodococcus oxybenzonivorans]MDV7345082.1 NAD(P)/FAD-dependent oxidoreductase [Rhodococcus oxybenzonivorans]
MSLPQHVHTLVVGAGFAGMGLAARILRSRPEADVLIIERGYDVGGTWRDNTYPGCACDVPTSLYSFSFAPSADWSHTFARQPEIYRYLKKVAADTGILSRVVTDCALEQADWDDAKAVWHVRTSRGSLTADVVVAATGALSTPSIPDMPGLDTFGGTTFHSATWNHDHDLTGERVAVIGTGASAMQFVPEIAPRAKHVTVFQRTPAWVIPRLDRVLSDPEKRLYRRIPLVQKAVRASVYSFREALGGVLAHATGLLPLFEMVARAHLRRQVRDPELRQKLTPDFTIGCKRMLLSNDWLRTLDRPDVTLVDAGLAGITEDGVVDAVGNEHKVDTIIFATGFTPTEPPVAHALRGTDGHTLAEHWKGSPHAYKGTTVAGFPNLFLMYGPNTNLGHSSIVYMLESQSAYITDALDAMRDNDITAFEVTEEAQRRYNARIQSGLQSTVWNKGGCSSWYYDAEGRNSVQWPTFTFRFRSQLQRFDRENYVARRRSEKEAVA